MSVRDQVLQLLDRMDDPQRLRLLEVAKGLLTETPPPSASARLLLERMDSFQFASGEVERMQAAIEVAFEQIHDE